MLILRKQVELYKQSKAFGKRKKLRFITCNKVSVFYHKLIIKWNYVINFKSHKDIFSEEEWMLVISVNKSHDVVILLL